MLLLGALHGLTFSLPAPVAALAGFAQITMFTLIWIAVAGRRPGPTAALGLLFGVGNFVVGPSWLYISMNSFGGLPGILAASAVVLLSSYLALFGAGALALANGWLRRADPTDSYGPGRTACLVAACWGIGEIARGFVLTGFPWLSVGYAHLDAPWHGLAAWVGAYGLGAFAILLAVWLAELLRRRTGRAVTGQGRATSSILLTSALSGILDRLTYSRFPNFCSTRTALLASVPAIATFSARSQPAMHSINRFRTGGGWPAWSIGCRFSKSGWRLFSIMSEMIASFCRTLPVPLQQKRNLLRLQIITRTGLKPTRPICRATAR